MENCVAAVERARLRTAAQQSQKHSTACDGYAAVLGLTTASRSIAASCYSSATTKRGEPGRTVENRVAAVERARLRTAAQQSQNIQPRATGTPQCADLRPLRARSQPRVTRQRLHNVENRGELCSRCRACEAAYGCAAVAKHSTECDGYAAVLGVTTASRSIAASCYSSATTKRGEPWRTV